ALPQEPFPRKPRQGARNQHVCLLRQWQVREIRVLVIDADLHAVAAVADLAVEMRHRRTHWISAANFNDRAAASNRLSRVQIVASTVNIVDASKWASTHPMPNPDNFRLTINSKTSLLLAIVALGRRFS